MPFDATAPIPLDTDLLCGGCAQNLRGVAGERCPECGRRFDRRRLVSTAVPWELRVHAGRVRTFVQTVAVGVVNPTRFLDPQHPPVTLAAARRFRRWAVVILFVATAAPAFHWFARVSHNPPWGYLSNAIASLRVPDLRELEQERWFFYTSLAAWWATLTTWTGAAAWFFAPRSFPPERQRQAVAASLYVCSSWTIALVACSGALVASRALGSWNGPWKPPNLVAGSAFYAALLAMPVVLVGFWWTPGKLLRSLSASRRRAVLFAVAWPLLAIGLPIAALAAVAFVVLSASVYFCTI